MFDKALDIALDVMRKTLNKSAFELHYGRKPNTEISNLLNLDTLKKITDVYSSKARHPPGVLTQRVWRCL